MSREAEASRPRPRERIIETARDLFRKHGFRGVGVDAIAEAAGTNKMTLYRHFGSKDDLIASCLSEVAIQAQAMWKDFESERPDDPMGQLHAWVGRATACAMGDSRGCDIANAAVELTEPNHPARKVIEQFKRDHRDRLARLCRAAGVAQADLLADALTLLLEGARMSWQSVGTDGPGARFVEISNAVIACFCENAERSGAMPAARSSDGDLFAMPGA
jgi:AcrR family transcriptional regulator